MVKGINEINIYFPDFTSDELPERDYLIAIISTINPDATKKIVEEARMKRSICATDNLNNLVDITPEFKDEFMSKNPQKSIWVL